ncbi:MAG: hypothetical protein JOZ99_06835 [Actinobacteria bacterium]|nr:hypothetical protein [Actinomycetota bacterium]
MKIRLLRTSRLALGIAVLGVLAVGAPALPSAGAATTPSSPSGPAAASGVNVSGSPYWTGWDIVRGVALTHPTTPGAQPGGYVLDAWGGIHEFGGAPPMASSHYTPRSATSHNIGLEGDDAGGVTMNSSARTFVFPVGASLTRQPSTACDDTSRFGIPTRAISFDPMPVVVNNVNQYQVNGAVMDAWGGIHPFCNSTETINTAGAPWWGNPAWQIAYGLAILPGGTGGFTLDGWGGVHAWGKAQLATPPDTYWGPRAGVKAWNIARGVAIDGTGSPTQLGNGVVVDGWGGLHTFTYTTLP